MLILITILILIEYWNKEDRNKGVRHKQQRLSIKKKFEATARIQTAQSVKK